MSGIQNPPKFNEMGVPVIQEAINAYLTVTATDEFKKLERQRHYVALSRATALCNASLADKDALTAKLQTRLGADK